MSLTAWIALLIGLAVGVMGGMYVRRSEIKRARPRRAADRRALPTSTEHMLDLLRRLHGANAVCLVGRDADPVIATGVPATAPKSLDRAISLAQLAMGDGREHVTREGECVVAVGDGASIAGVGVAASPSEPSSSQAASPKSATATTTIKAGQTRWSFHIGAWLSGCTDILRIATSLC